MTLLGFAARTPAWLARLVRARVARVNAGIVSTICRWRRVRRVVQSVHFEVAILVLIVFNGVIIGVETDPHLSRPTNRALYWINAALLAVFTLEIVGKMIAIGVMRYFDDSWK